MSFAAGQIVGNYQILSKLGTGGMGAVYLAEHPLIGKKVALKVIHRELSGNREVVQRFFQEARAVNTIGHEHIVEIHDFGQTPEGDHFYIMEFLDGLTLAQAISRERRLDVRRSLHITAQICSGLAAAHACGVIHRDLKPDNIMLLPRQGADFIKILDFGLAKMFSSGNAPLTAMGVVLGTPQYMSPEACESKRDVDHRTDVYAVGVLLFQMLTGQLPFDGASMGEVLVKQVTQLPPAPRGFNPEIPPSVEQIVLRCLAKTAAGRFQTMEALRDAILAPDQYLASSPPMSAARSVAPGEANARTMMAMAPARAATSDPAPRRAGTDAGPLAHAATMALTAAQTGGMPVPQAPRPTAGLAAAGGGFGGHGGHGGHAGPAGGQGQQGQGGHGGHGGPVGGHGGGMGGAPTMMSGIERGPTAPQSSMARTMMAPGLGGVLPPTAGGGLGGAGMPGGSGMPPGGAGPGGYGGNPASQARTMMAPGLGGVPGMPGAPMGGAMGAPGPQVPPPAPAINLENRTMIIATPVGYISTPPRRRWRLITAVAALSLLLGTAILVLTRSGGSEQGGATADAAMADAASDASSDASIDASGAAKGDAAVGATPRDAAGATNPMDAPTAPSDARTIPDAGAAADAQAAASDARTPPDANAADAAAADAAVAAAGAVVEIQSVPPGAIIWIAGQERGPAPLTLTFDAATKKLSIEAKLAGYTTKRQTVKLEAEGKTSVQFNLEKRRSSDRGDRDRDRDSDSPRPPVRPKPTDKPKPPNDLMRP